MELRENAERVAIIEWPDPLRIYYFMILGDDELPAQISPFQGFGRNWVSLHWAMRAVTSMPADIDERTHDPADIAVQRIAGGRRLSWYPLDIAALEELTVDQLPVCCVLFSGAGDEAVARRIEAWRAKVNFAALHISQYDGLGISAQNFQLGLLRDYCIRKLRVEANNLTGKQSQIVAQSDVPWDWPETTLESYDVKGHNIAIPNHMAMARVGYKLRPSVPFASDDEKDYTDAIIESAGAVLKFRQAVGNHDIFALSSATSGAILFEPAFFRGLYDRLHVQGLEGKALRRALRYFQKQRGLSPTHAEDDKRFFTTSKMARVVSGIRADELRTQTLAVGLLAAQTTTPVIRMTPAVNHVFTALSDYARNVRAERPEARRKAPRLFAEIQRQLSAAVGEERVDFIKRTNGPLKIVSDAPLEWLPIDDLPLSFRRECSRIPVTPGNVLMGQLLSFEPVFVTASGFRKVLVVSSFAPTDPLRDLLSGSINIIRDAWPELELVHVKISSVEELEAALNQFDGAILIFDGHGAPNDKKPVGRLEIGNQSLDVWSLRGKVRCPPIVILSACDTHGIDASSHATVANGFIVLGARTVLATFLPVDGRRSAMLIGRLMHRLAEFTPNAVRAYGRAITWTEIVSGMLRMSLATEIISELTGPPGSATFDELQGHANVEINGLDSHWFDKLIDRLAGVRGLAPSAIRPSVLAAIAKSDTIRYTQLGNPEAIILSDESLIEIALQEGVGTSDN
ncbi:CHAT domain-containing protein [Rhizobium sp. NPDC090275]|uniref:CHAT domain-containing protein n=1 Tax=Rhizobium sp. NPDC090275 TaxID=3364498 RepID=UPI00383BA24F